MRTYRCVVVTAAVIIYLLASGCELLGLVPAPGIVGTWRGMKETGDVLFIGIDLDRDGCPEAMTSYVRE